MSVRNQNWYNLAESTPYPIEGDVATLLADDGTRLPTNIVCDLNLLFPSFLGQYAYLTACTVTSRLVTVVIFASGDPQLAVQTAPLAAVTIPQPVQRYRPYPVDALADGVGGWIVFGGGIDDTFSGRFSTPAQSLFSPRAARAYQQLPVTGMGRYGSGQLLDGVVRLVAGNDVEIVSETRDVPVSDTPGSALVSKEVVVIRLKADIAGASRRNVFDIYKGGCGGRPESHTCGEPQPIEAIGGVTPDDTGNITPDMRGCVVVSEIAREVVIDDYGELVQEDVPCGILLDCDFGLAANCHNKDNLPDSVGVLPGDVEDPCSVVSINLDTSETSVSN
jgi:hypothetical protein